MGLLTRMIFRSLKPLFALLCTFSAISNLHAQPQLNYIALDHTVFDFSTGTFKTFELPSITDVKYRYMSTISTPSGQLALISLITFGPTSFSILDRNGNIMPHGRVSLGDQECNLIVPNPCDSNIYYVFVQTENNPNGLAYVTVDMTLNGGLGDVSATPTILLSRNLTDNVFATPMADGKGYWVIVHDYLQDQPVLDSTYGFSYFVYKVTAEGVDPNPIISKGAYSGPGGDDEWPSCISSDGKTIFYPSAHFARKIPQGWVAERFAGGELMSFDATSGKISHRQLIGVPSGVNGIYNAVFSPDGSKLYISLDGPNDLGQIVQVDLSNGDSSTIVGSMTTIVPEAGRFISGPDGKIYVYATITNPRNVATDIKIINFPNAAGTACNYQSNFLEMGRLMWNAASVEEVSRFLPSASRNSLSFGSFRIIKDSFNITVHLPIVFHHSGIMSYVDMIMHYPTDGSLKFLSTSLYNGKTFDVPGSQWTGRVGVHFDAADLNAAPDSIIGYVNFQWRPIELNCAIILFDSLQTTMPNCSDPNLANFQGVIGSFDECGMSSVTKEASEQPSFKIFPNPANIKIEVQFNSTSMPLHYELFDAFGITRKQGNQNGNSLALDVSDLPSGNYYLRVATTKDIAVTRTIAVMH